MATPEIPTIRSLMGQLALRKSTAVSATLSLYKLIGGLTDGDIAVMDVVGAVVDALDALKAAVTAQPTALVAGTYGGHQLLGVYSHVTAGAGWETVATIASDASGTYTAWLVKAEISAISDDGQDVLAYEVTRSFCWNGVALGAGGALVKVLDHDAGGAFDARIEASGTDIVVQVGGIADYRVTAAVRVTRTSF